MKTHGETHSGRTPEYVAWISIKHRCYDKTYSGYARYGGRGIRVCDEWLKSYEAFLAYVGRKPTPKHQIDRWPNNDGNYEPGNVRWATAEQNTRNRKSGLFVEYRGETKCVAEWAEITGVTRYIIYQRLYRGWDMEKIISTPVGHYPTRNKGLSLKLL